MAALSPLRGPWAMRTTTISTAATGILSHALQLTRPGPGPGSGCYHCRQQQQQQQQPARPFTSSRRPAGYREIPSELVHARPSRRAAQQYRRLLSSSSRNARSAAEDKAASTSSSSSSLPPLVSKVEADPSFPPSTFPEHFGANQILPLPPSTDSRLTGLLNAFQHPTTPIRFAFAYGSGVFPQSSAGPEHAKRPASPASGKKMVDLILAVAHPAHWHAMNMSVHRAHYSWLARSGGSALLGWVQQRGAAIWYHPYVMLGDELVKYGVISVDALCNDLIDWDTLYVSGRMHKPVAMITTDARVRLAQQVNLASALRVALLLLPEHFTEVELYTRIASLSYTGDFRMSVPGGENANKVRNIVLNQREQFRRLYAGLMRSLGTLTLEETREDRFAITQDVSTATRAELAARMPLRLRKRVLEHYLNRPDAHEAFAKLSLSKERIEPKRQPDDLAREPDLEAFWRAAVEQPDFANVLLTNISAIVKGPAWSQSVKGIYTAGLGRTWKYVMAKVGKWFEGRKESKEQKQE